MPKKCHRGCSDGTWATMAIYVLDLVSNHPHSVICPPEAQRKKRGSCDCLKSRHDPHGIHSPWESAVINAYLQVASTKRIQADRKLAIHQQHQPSIQQQPAAHTGGSAITCGFRCGHCSLARRPVPTVANPGSGGLTSSSCVLLLQSGSGYSGSFEFPHQFLPNSLLGP